MSITLDINPENCGQRISAMLFGCNVEVTRLGVWRGLGAEMVNNRKFAAADGNGLPLRWEVTGSPSNIRVDRNFGYAGNLSLLIAGKDCGIFQESDVLTFAGNTQYNIRLVVHSDSIVPVTLKIIYPSGDTILFEKQYRTIPGQWTTFTGSFIAENNCEKCRVEISAGNNECIHIGAVSVQRADAIAGMRKEVVEIFKELHPASLRYPGGCYAEFFRWQDSLLPVDQRPAVGPSWLPFLLPENDDFDPVEIGLDEFITLCRLTGAEPAITVRMSEVPAGDAADLVEYCNGSSDTFWGGRRAAGGNIEPYGIKYWFLGNELWSFGRGGLNDPAVCAEKTAEFAAAMRRVDPAIHLTGCSFYAQEHWNKPLQQAAGKWLDEYSMHDYLFDHFKQKEDLEAIAKAPTTELRPYLEKVRDSLLSGMPSDKELSIVLDEWNLRWGAVGTVAMGLYAAGVLNLLCRESENLRITRGYYFMAVNEGIVRVTPYSAYLDASGLMFGLFQSHCGKKLLSLPPVDALADVDYCASFDQEKQVVNVTLINRNMSDERLIKLTLPEGYSVKSAACRGYEPVELLPVSEKFRTFEKDMNDSPLTLTLAPAQVVCWSIELA